MPKVAAIIPTYNREHCIARAIESVLSQTYSDIEVIVVDDGSTDETRRIVTSFGNSVTYILQENAGQGPARNRGVAETNAEWIAFLDSDDAWLPTKIERQLEFTERCEAEVSFTDFSLKRNLDGEGYESWYKELQSRGRQIDVSSGRVEKSLDLVLGPGDLIFTSTMLIHRQAFEEVGGFRPKYRRCQDVDLYTRLVVAQKAEFAFLAELLVRRDMGGNATRKLTYEFKLSAFADAYKNALSTGQKDVTSRLHVALLHELRAYIGVCRREGAIFDAINAVTRLCLLRIGSELGIPRVL